MFQQPLQPLPRRSLKTSEPRFKRLDRLGSPDARVTTQQNFTQINKAYALDNSKQNLFYQTHLSKVRSACRLDETAIVSKYLSSIRKDYDDMSKLSRKELNSMKLKKRQIEFMRQKNQIFCDKRQELEVEIEGKEKQMDQVKSKEEDAKMQTKTLENIIVRMKKDHIFYKQYGRIRDEQLKRTLKHLKLLDEHLIHEEEKLLKLSNTLQNCKDLYSLNRQTREKKFEDYSSKISDVQERDRFIHERKERTYELQSIELNDTLDEKNIHMREIILAHKVADSLLEGKVNSLIQKYSDIQGAFHLVKIRTGVTEPQLLTSKFFSYEQISESLLQTISENQKYIQELRLKRQILIKQHKSLTNQHLLEEGSYDSPNHSQQAQKQRLINQTYHNQLLIDQIQCWINRNLVEIRQSECPKNTTLDNKFLMLCDNLKKNLKKYEDYDWSAHQAQTIGVCMKKMIREKSPEQLSIRLRETQDMNESNLIEEEYIKTSRKNIQKKAFTIKQIKRQSHQ